MVDRTIVRTEPEQDRPSCFSVGEKFGQCVRASREIAPIGRQKKDMLRRIARRECSQKGFRNPLIEDGEGSKQKQKEGDRERPQRGATSTEPRFAIRSVYQKRAKLSLSARIRPSSYPHFRTLRPHA